MQNRSNGDEKHPGNGEGPGGASWQATRIRVAVLDSHDLIREGLAALFAGTEDLECVGTWSDPQVAVRQIENLQPDVLLVDVHLPEQAAFETLRLLPTISPQTRVIVTVDCREEQCVILNPHWNSASHQPLRVVSQAFSEPDDCLQIALKMGAHGVVRKQSSFRYLVQAIRSVHAGQHWMELPTATRLAQQYLITLRPGEAPAKSGVESLTLRERQVVTLIAQGRSNKEIAHELHLGYSTVKNYVSSILEKLALGDRTQIALYAIDQNVIEA
ncbi:MAG: LuxR C-terminal-related transcriptional regulator [Chthonomonadales bacterium]